MTVDAPPTPLLASVCICTRNRPVELSAALASVAASSLPAAQVVVSDDSDDDATAKVVEESGLPITYVRGPRTGLGANRNAAIDAARGDFVLFLDDDAALGIDFLLTMERRLREIPEERRQRSILAGVEIIKGWTVVPNEQSFLGFQSRPYREGESLRTVVINAALFPTELFDQVRFDPNLRYGFDEVDFTTQAVARGFEIVPCFEASNLHNPSTLGRDDYGDAAIAARLYVTFKRRSWTEGSPVRARVGLVLASIHVFLALVRQKGPRQGATRAASSIARAWRDSGAYHPDHGPRREIGATT